ncbi:MAG: Dam family site-specific DNA-(adenine-N6)-methyltransferase [Verrucomicrobiota bacterium]|nr:Dam family site-specific DNA-(adenine-N6)-methyltransferase [Verrucomicrobiota bacterium]
MSAEQEQLVNYQQALFQDFEINQPTTSPYVRPFLKWAGNKYSLLDYILPTFTGRTKQRLIEPFVGSGAVFLNAGFCKNFVADVNKDIINLYAIIAMDVEAFIADCKQLFMPENNSSEAFYSLRSEFNETKDIYRKSLIFVYLNRHCFNGLCRYNSRGEFNVPFGKYKKTYFPDVELRYFSDICACSTFRCQSFQETIETGGAGDVIYCDPPYVPLSKTSSFSTYSAGGFGYNDQKELVDCCIDAVRRGALVVISNHDNETTQQLYKGARIIQFEVQRFISCNGEGRNKVPELLAIYNPLKNG